jgi:hypothetical protein
MAAPQRGQVGGASIGLMRREIRAQPGSRQSGVFLRGFCAQGRIIYFFVSGSTTVFDEPSGADRFCELRQPYCFIVCALPLASSRQKSAREGAKELWRRPRWNWFATLNAMHALDP